MAEEFSNDEFKRDPLLDCIPMPAYPALTRFTAYDEGDMFRHMTT